MLISFTRWRNALASLLIAQGRRRAALLHSEPLSFGITHLEVLPTALVRSRDALSAATGGNSRFAQGGIGAGRHRHGLASRKAREHFACIRAYVFAIPARARLDRQNTSCAVGSVETHLFRSAGLSRPLASNAGLDCAEGRGSAAQLAIGACSRRLAVGRW